MQVEEKLRYFILFSMKGVFKRYTILLFIVAIVPSTLIGQKLKDTDVQEIAATKLRKRDSLEKQLTIVRKQKDVSMEMETLMNLVNFISNDFGDLSSSYIYARELEKLILLHPNLNIAKKYRPVLFHNMGWYLSEQGKLEESIDYFNKSIETDPKSYLGLYFDNMNQLAEVYTKMGDTARCRQTLMLLADALSNFPKDHPDASFNELRYYKTMRDIKYIDRDFFEGLAYAKKSIDSIDGFSVTSYGYTKLAEFYLQLDQLDSAKWAAEIGLDLAHTHMFKLEEANGHYMLYTIYENEQDYQRALYHFEKWSEIKSDIVSFDNALKIGVYDVASERNKANLERAMANQKLGNQRLIIWIVSIFVLVLLIGLFYLFYSFRLIKEKNKIIQIEKQRAEQSERFKEQFLANMSHEIRTPMHAISGMLNALKRRSYSQEQGDYLNAMQLSINNLLVILNDILDLSKIETGNLQLVSVPIDVKEIVSEVVKLLSYKAEEKDIALTLNVSADFPNKLLGDPVRLNQIVVNLIGNAIKFTEKGKVIVSLKKHDHHYSIEVQDTGLGIQKASLKSIFETFKQGEEGLNKGYSGTGLGLSITKQLVELQGGKIAVVSELGKGSTFLVELPLLESPLLESTLERDQPEQLLEIGKTLAGIKVLIAEDNEFNVMVLEDDLQWCIPEIQLTVVTNGAMAIEKFKEDSYDIILMDVQMPEIDGYEATRQIRTLENQNNAKRTPIIAMTAGILKNQSALCMEAGMDNYILKPYHPKELLQRIAEVLA